MNEREALKLEWTQAPVKTQWGQDMVVACVAIDKDHTLDLYCERDQTQKVETMLTQRTWVGLTDEERNEITNTVMIDIWQVARAIEAKLKEKNT